MHGDVVLAVAAVLAVGVAAQWLGWRVRVPAIVFLLAAGLVAGPLTGLLEPDELFGDLLFPFVNLAVAVILFEGALGLTPARLRSAGRTVFLLLTVGASITMVLTAAFAHQILGVTWSLAWLIAGVLVVTGPTVIGPLVHSLGLRGRVASVLEAEGTLIDPIGAILTVFIFQVFFEGGDGGSVPAEMLWTFVAGVALGLVGAWLLTVSLGRFIVPDELHNVATLAMVILVFALADAAQPEAGLVAVTVMGVALASQTRVEVQHVLEFNETLRTLFISSLFILLGARISSDTLRLVEWRNVAFVAVLVLIVRPVAVAVSTVGSGLSRNERGLRRRHRPTGDRRRRHRVDLLPAARRPGDRRVTGPGVGHVHGDRRHRAALGSGSPSARPPPGPHRRFPPPGRGPRDQRRRRRPRRGPRRAGGPRAAPQPRPQGGVVGPSVRPAGAARSVLDEAVWEQMAEDRVGSFVAVTANDEANAIACRRAGPLVGRRNVFRLASDRKEHASLASSRHTPGRLLMGEEITYPLLAERVERGWAFHTTRLTETFGEEAYRAHWPEESLVVAVVRADGVDFAAAGQPVPMRPGSVVVALVPPDPAEPGG